MLVRTHPFTKCVVFTLRFNQISIFCSSLFLNTRIFWFSPTLTSLANMSVVEEAKKLAACAAINNHVKDHSVIGIGSGSTVVYAVEKLAEKVHKEKLNVICIPTSFQSELLIHENNLVMGNLSSYPEIDVVIDGADEVDSNLNLIKGGGGCLLQEKIIASCSKSMVVVADFQKKASNFGEKWKKGLPIEVIPVSYKPVMSKIMKRFDGEIELRMAKMKSGPVITDNGNFIIDWKFPSNQTCNWQEINNTLKMIPGVVETGLFVGMATKVYFGMQDGTVAVLDCGDVQSLKGQVNSNNLQE